MIGLIFMPVNYFLYVLRVNLLIHLFLTDNIYYTNYKVIQIYFYLG